MIEDRTTEATEEDGGRAAVGRAVGIQAAGAADMASLERATKSGKKCTN
jgi:hypothetical protein